MTLCLGLLLPALALCAEEPQQAAPSALLTMSVLKGRLEKTDTVSLTLKDALQMALDENPTVDAAKLGVNMAKHKYQTSLAQMLPDISLSYDITNYEGAVQTFGSQVIDVLRNTYQPQLVFRFPVFQGGKRFFQARSDKKLLQGEQANSRNTTHEILKSTALAYYGFQGQVAALASAQKQFEETEALLQVNTARLEAGAGTRLDVLQSEAQVAKARLGVLTALSSVEKAALNLNELLNLPAFSDAMASENLEDKPLTSLVPDTYSLSALNALALTHRPDLKTLEKQVESVKALRQMAWSILLPEITLQMRTGGVGSSFAGMRSFDQTGANVSFNFKNLGVPAWTLYQQESAHIDMLAKQTQSLQNRIRNEVSQAVLTSLTAKEQVLAAKAQLTAASQAKEDALERLNAGIGRNLDLLDAETQLSEARTALNQSYVTYHSAQVSLIDALGLTSIDTLTQGIPAP